MNSITRKGGSAVDEVAPLAGGDRRFASKGWSTIFDRPMRLKTKERGNPVFAFLALMKPGTGLFSVSVVEQPSRSIDTDIDRPQLPDCTDEESWKGWRTAAPPSSRTTSTTWRVSGSIFKLRARIVSLPPFDTIDALTNRKRKS